MGAGGSMVGREGAGSLRKVCLSEQSIFTDIQENTNEELQAALTGEPNMVKVFIK